jgi:acetyl-CoA carboxylase biotin carboxyl carrier protein
LNFKEILELIDKVADSGISSVEIEQAGTKVRVEGKRETPNMFASYSHHEMRPEPGQLPAMSVPALQAAAPVAAPSAPRVDEDAGLHIINSPIVGTFYRASNPESPPFVNVGDRVSKGQVLCIIEAMKLMNEIESDVDGVITAIYPQNGQPIEYGEPLCAVKV